MMPIPATAKAVRGEPSATIVPPSRKPTPGTAAPSDSSRPDIRAWYSDGVASCSRVITATHWTPLPAPPRTEAMHATASVCACDMPR